MRGASSARRLLGGILFGGLMALEANAADVVYVTDLSIYTYLAPCVARAVSQHIALQTSGSNCPEDVTGLQLCICRANLAAVSSGISVSVSSACGSTASDDQASASSVLVAYCNQVHALGAPSVTTARASSQAPTNSPPPDEPKGPHGPSQAAIAGAVIGAVVGLLIAGVVIFFMWRRGRKLQKEQANASQSSNAANKPAAPAAVNLMPTGRQGGVELNNVGRAPHAESSSAAPPPYEPGEFGEMYRNRNV